MDYGERDKIVTLYTPDLGKIHAIAKGVRRSTSRMGGHVDLFAHASILLIHGRTLHTITQGQARQTFPHLREDLTALGQACLIAELVDRFVEDHNPHQDLFRALVRALEHINAEDTPGWTLILFQLQLLALVGYRPQLHRCVNCNTSIEPGENRFDVELGGVLCPQCGPVHRSARPIQDGALKALRNAQTRGESIFRVTLLPTARDEAAAVLALYVHYLLERRPNSATFLDLLGRLERP